MENIRVFELTQPGEAVHTDFVRGLRLGKLKTHVQEQDEQGEQVHLAAGNNALALQIN